MIIMFTSFLLELLVLGFEFADVSRKGCPGVFSCIIVRDSHLYVVLPASSGTEGCFEPGCLFSNVRKSKKEVIA